MVALIRAGTGTCPYCLFVRTSPTGTIFLRRNDLSDWNALTPCSFNDETFEKWPMLGRALEWVRLPGDAVFIVGGAFPLVWLCWRAVRFPNPRRIAAEAELPRLLFTDESESRGS